MLGILSMLVGFASLAFFVIVEIKLFQAKGPVHGILGILSCGIYPFIWGWMNATNLNIKNIMLAWTAAFVAGLVLNVLNAMAGASAVMSQ